MRNDRRCVWIGLIAALLIGCVCTPSEAVFWRTDWPTGDPEWRTTKEGYMKNAALVVVGGGFGSGTLIQDDWVLTARHVVNNNLNNPGGISVNLGSYGSFGVSQVHVPNNNGDIALLKLDSVPTDALQIPLNDVNDETGKLIEIGGYGSYGPAGNQQGTGLFHRAQNVVTSVNGWDLVMWFTNPSNPNALDREGTGASGDSGGTVLMDDGAGQWYLAASHRAGTTTNPRSITAGRRLRFGRAALSGGSMGCSIRCGGVRLRRTSVI